MVAIRSLGVAPHDINVVDGGHCIHRRIAVSAASNPEAARRVDAGFFGSLNWLMFFLVGCGVALLVDEPEWLTVASATIAIGVIAASGIALRRMRAWSVFLVSLAIGMATLVVARVFMLAYEQGEPPVWFIFTTGITLLVSLLVAFAAFVLANIGDMGRWRQRGWLHILALVIIGVSAMSVTLMTVRRIVARSSDQSTLMLDKRFDDGTNFSLTAHGSLTGKVLADKHCW
jgi:hypothetical protein